MCQVLCVLERGAADDNTEDTQKKEPAISELIVRHAVYGSARPPSTCTLPQESPPPLLLRVIDCRG